MDLAPYYVAAANGGGRSRENIALPDGASSRDADLAELDSLPKNLADIESSRFVAHTRDTFAQEDAQEYQPVSHDEGDSFKARPSSDAAASAEHTPSNPFTNRANSNPQNMAGAYTGVGQGPGGVSTPNPSGGGTSSGGGTANLPLPTETQLQQLTAGANNAANQQPAAQANDASPTVSLAAGTNASPSHGDTLDTPEAPNGHGPGLSLHNGAGQLISGPTISATEGVVWQAGITISDSDSDDSNPHSPGDDITGTIDWGDGNSTPFNAPVSEGGNFIVDTGHTWMETGTYNVVITANDPDSGTSQITETADVVDGQLTWSTIGEAAPNTPPTWSQSFDTPSLPTINDRTNTEGDNVNLPIQASDPDGSALSYDALDLPPGLSINSSSGLISGTVAYGAADEFDGTYEPTIVVADNDGSNETSFSWTIDPAPIAPVLTNPGNQTNLRGDNVSLQLIATQIDNNPLTYSASNLPTGLSIDSETGLISGTVDPSATLGVPYAVTATATDDVTNLSDSQNFNWTINTTNVAPALTSPGNQTNSAGDAVSLQLSATDTDGDPLTYTATGLPPGLTIDPISGLISGALPNSDASSTPYSVTVTSSDSMASNSQSFTWTVHAVSLQNPGAQSSLDGGVVSLQLPASDANNATLSYSASGLPSGLSISSSTGLISGTIASNADTNSPYSVTVTATDSNNDSVSQSFAWTVARLALNVVNDQENQEGTAVSLQMSATDHEGTPTFSASGLPPGVSINSTTGLISGTVGIGSFGNSPYQVTVTATDGSYTSSQSFVWTVTPRVALVNPGDQSNAVGDSVSLQLSATSPGGTMSYSASGLPSGLSINSSSGLISGTIASGDDGNSPYTVTVTANDGTSSNSQTFSWTIAVINLVSPGDQTNNDGDTVSLSLTTGYHGSGTLSYSATGLPPELSINSSNGQITGTISGTADTNSPYSVTVNVTDGTNTGSQSFYWAVNAVVAIDTIDDQSNAAGDTVSLQVTASDTLNNTLTYSATNLPSGLSINSTSGLIGGTIAVGADSSSPYAVTLTVTDSAGNSATQSFNWTVTHVLLVNPGPLQNLDGANVSLQLQGSDADGDKVTYTASGLPGGLSINTSTGLISGTIASNADKNSPYNVTLTASDGTNTTTQTFLWTVLQVSLALPSDQTNNEGDNVSLQLQGTTSTGSLSYSVSGLPPGLSFNTTTGVFSGTLAAGDAANGPYVVDVSASNGTVSTSQSFNWFVNPVVNLTVPADQNNIVGDNVSLQISATDSLNKTLSYSATGLPSGLSINSSTGLISGQITGGDSSGGPFVVSVTASDGTYSSIVSFNWNVTDWATLTMTAPGTQDNVASDSVVNLQVSASDPDGDTLTYSATSLPDGLSIDPSTGLISGTIDEDAADPAPYQTTVTATDGNGQSVSQTFTWIVNAPPIIAQASPLNFTEGVDPVSFTIATFTTPDLNSTLYDFAAIINYGDGTIDTGSICGSDGSFIVTADHIYAEKGTYAVSIQIIDRQTGSNTTTTTTATVADGALTLTGGFESGDPMSDAQGGFQLAVLADANPDATSGDYTVTVNWGDGTIDTGAPMVHVLNVNPGQFLISGSHSYPNPWPQGVGPVNYTVSISVTDADGASASTTSTVVVGNVVPGLQATMGGWAFVDQNTYATPGDFVYNGQTGVVEINWGDGTSSLGTLAGSGGDGAGPVTFSIYAWHTYSRDSLDQPGGVYPIKVTVTDDDGNTLIGTQYVSVVRPPLAQYTGNVTIPSNLEVSNAAVAIFTVPDALDPTSEFAAQINWGDGTVNNGTIQEVAPGLFQVVGSHTYAVYDWYYISVTISQGWSGMVSADAGDGLAGRDPEVGFRYTNYPGAIMNLRVALWQPDAFLLSRGAINLNPDLYNEVWPRYIVWVKDPSANKNNGGKETITVHVSSSSDTGSDLQAKETGNDTGIFETKNLLIVSVKTDKQAAGVQGIFVRLGDTVSARYGHVQDVATVPVKYVVNLRIYILRDKKEADGGKPVISITKVQGDVKWLNEIYAQAQIRFDASIDTVDPPPGVDLSDGLDSYLGPGLSKEDKIPMTNEEKALLNAYGHKNAADDTYIAAFYVNYLATNHEDNRFAGESFWAPYSGFGTIGGVPDPKYADSVIVSADHKFYTTLAHEIGHVLLDSGDHPDGNEGVNKVNLMAFPFQLSGEVTDSRRITDLQKAGMTFLRPNLLLKP